MAGQWQGKFAPRRRRTGVIGVALVMGVGVLGLGVAQGASVSKPNLTASATAAITPTRLPAVGAAPVELTIKGSSSWADPLSPTSRAFVSSLELRLDRQITVDTEGLATCSKADVDGVPLNRARQNCGAALIGSGSNIATFYFVEEEPITLHYTDLFFNSRKAGAPSVLMYAYSPDVPAESAPAQADPVGTGRDLELPFSYEDAGATSLQFRFGRTWRYQKRKHSYLSGRCATGALKNRLILTLGEHGVGAGAPTVSDATPERCTKRS